MFLCRACLTLLLGVATVQRCDAANREYYIRAEEVLWDYGPSGTDLITGQPFDGHTDADLFMVNRPTSRQIGSQYWKCLYFEYEDGTFSQKKPRPSWMGMVGPTLRAEVGDRLAVTFQNQCHKRMSMHPHGVKYTKAFEGAPYLDGRDARGDHLATGETYTYLWVADENAGPGPNDGSSVAWVYHSHNPEQVDANAGLIGLIVVTRRGEAHPDGSPKDVDMELVLYLSVINENLSYLRDRNIREFIEDNDAPLTEEEHEVLITDERFVRSNLMHSINGLQYGNLQGVSVPAGRRIRWYVFCTGDEEDLHTMHWKGQTVLYRGQRVSGVQLMGGVASVATMSPVVAGEWGMYSHMRDHIRDGMISMFTVEGPSVAVEVRGRLRQHYIQAEEIVWDYAPSGMSMYNTSLEEDESASHWFEHGDGALRIGGQYWKCLYRGYTDASFSTPLPRPAQWEHLGFLGPVIRGEVGDRIQVVFRNACTKAASIDMPAVMKSKEHEGWHYGSASTPAGSGVVAPGGTHTYEWHIADGPGPLDLSSVGFVYISHEENSVDTNSGLMGPLIITAFGAANEAGEPMDVEDELVVLMGIFDEGDSYLLDRNVDDFIGGLAAEEVEALKEDKAFKCSNRMHGINGYLFGNLVPPQLTAGRKARVYGMAVGTDIDMHSLRMTGHSFLIRGERRAQLSLLPGDVYEADILPTAGTWAVFCQTNHHIARGMIGQVVVAESPEDDPLLVMSLPGSTRRYYLQAEEVVWDYGAAGADLTGQYAFRHQNYTVEARQPTDFEQADGLHTMAHDPAVPRIGRQYIKCIFVGYNADYSEPEDRTEGSRWRHLGVLGPMIHAEEGDTLIIELRNRCTIPVSLHAQIARSTKEDEGFEYQNADGEFVNRGNLVVQPGGSRTYTWHIKEGPGPEDPSSIGTLYYSAAHRMSADINVGLKGPLVITRRGFANLDGSPKDVATEFALFLEVTNEGESLYLDQNFERFVQSQRRTRLTPEEVAAVYHDHGFKESNLMHHINGLMYANLPGLRALAETKVRWYTLGLGGERDMHTVHWHAHTVRFAGHNLDVIMGMPATGTTADMYVDNVGAWLLHCHINKHINMGMLAAYVVEENPARGEAQISTCQQMYGRAADVRRESFRFDDSFFEGHPFQQMLSPYFRIAYTVNYTAQYVDMSVAAKTTGWLGLGFYGLDDAKTHAMIDTDMILAWVQDGVVHVEDRFAQGMETPKLDTALGGADQLTQKEGFEENGVTYVRFRRSFRPEDLDEQDFAFAPELEQVKVVYAYSSINADNLVYHGPTRGYGQIPWNMNCSSNYFFNLRTSECEGCDRGHHRIASNERFSLTRCLRCPVGTFADVRGGDRTTEECEPCGFAHNTTLYPGATSVADCVCKRGYFHPCEGEGCLTRSNERAVMRSQDAPFCLPCPTGMSCEGGVEDLQAVDLQHAQPTVPKGYYATPELTVFKCYGGAGRCPGGGPETCAEGRTGIQCAHCEPGKKTGEDFKCVPCESADVAPFVLGIIALLVVMVVAYYFADNLDRSKQTQSMLLVGISSSQLFTLVQMMGALSMIAVDWPEYLRWLLQISRLFVFDIDLLHLECLGSMDPPSLFLTKVCMVVVLLVVVSAIHTLYVAIFHSCQFRKRIHSLIGALGTVFTIFFISLVATLLAPMQCIWHPSDKWTVRVYPTVICWEGGEHNAMMGVAVLGMLIPITFLSLSTWGISLYPKKMKQGDARFLKVVGFLIMRFRTEAYWYSIFYLIRNMLISVFPAFPDVVAQTMFIQATLVSSLCLTLVLQPWRVWQANVIDCGIVISMLLLITLAAFFVEGANAEVISYVCMAVILLVMAVIPCAVAYGIYLKFAPRRQKKFEYFLCHHKAAAGCFARFMKMILEVHANGEAFIDCDHLTDLDLLFDTVAGDTETLIVLCSKDILVRPWCVGEICTSRSNSVNVVKVIMHDFTAPTELWIASYGEHVPDLSVLTSRGITLKAVKETMRWLHRQPSIALPPKPTKHSLDGLAVTLAMTRNSSHNKHTFSLTGEQELTEKPDELPETDCFVLLDHSNIEAVATGHAFCLLLRKFFTDEVDHMPRVLPRGQEWPQRGERLLLLCTNGCLQQAAVLKAINVFAHRGGTHVPILADESFRFPAQGAFLKEHKAVLETVAASPEELEEILICIFHEICVSFQPMMASEAILKASAGTAHDRIRKAKRISTKDLHRSSKVTPVPTNERSPREPAPRQAAGLIIRTDGDSPMLPWPRGADGGEVPPPPTLGDGIVARPIGKVQSLDRQDSDSSPTRRAGGGSSELDVAMGGQPSNQDNDITVADLMHYRVV